MENNKAREFGLFASTSLVIASMIGTGIFTSLGYQVGPIPSGFALLLNWGLGGIIALSGALCYAEIATILKRNGGEYHYLSVIFNPYIGFLSGVISFVAGFAATLAAVSLAFGQYCHGALGLLTPKTWSVLALIVVTIFHLFGVKGEERFQIISGHLKLWPILLFCIVPFFLLQKSTAPAISFLPTSSSWDYVFRKEFLIALVYVSYSYSGWNASTYVAEVVVNPLKNLPKSILLGCIVVTVIYLMLNITFLSVADMHEYEGKIEIGQIVAAKLLGDRGGQIASILLSLTLISTLSALIISGARVIETMGEDYSLLSKLSRTSSKGSPYIAIIFQTVLALIMLASSAYDFLLQYVGLALSLSTFLTVLGLFVLRKRFPEVSGAFRTPFYPITPLFFLATNLGMIVFLSLQTPKIITGVLITLLAGSFLYLLVKKKEA